MPSVKHPRFFIRSVLLASTVFSLPCLGADMAAMVELGDRFFNDSSLSQPVGQSCATCHSADTGFTSPDGKINDRGAIIHGAEKKRSGNRKPPTSAYTTYSETFTTANGRPEGGTFWDGRATGSHVTTAIFPAHWDEQTTQEFSTLLGPAVDQAMGPLLNEVEQNLNDIADLCLRAQTSAGEQWEAAWGESLTCLESELETTHQRIAFAIAAFEHSERVSPFNSKWDLAIEASLAQHGEVVFPLDGLSADENLGRELYAANCAGICHNGTVEHDGIEKQLFARPLARYFNIGVPRNKENPFYDMDKVADDNGNVINPLGPFWVDLGVAGRDEDGIESSDFEGQEGRFKTPTLRNVGKKPTDNFVKAYTHNGYFKSLESLVHFYNTRDLKPACSDILKVKKDKKQKGKAILDVPSDSQSMAAGCWPLPEVSGTLSRCSSGEDCKVSLAEGETFETYCDNPENPRDLGNFCMTEAEEAALVAFLETLSDQ